jgi:DNA-binding phage protein
MQTKKIDCTQDDTIINAAKKTNSPTTHPNQHYGHAVEKVIRRNSVGISEIARKMGVSRRSIYNWFETEKIPTETIKRIGCVIGHDFSKEFPDEMRFYTELDYMKMQNIDNFSDKKNNHSVYYWMDRYIKLLENFNAILGEEHH